ncbi:MAG: C39 family peptidase [Candidatus Shapirobacteria bacterium]|nr:C39 family peptidase [Candidatus Shapirobacteria bacterium]MDD4410582.1 C39 family peptidase [Candidatus Shapirobacteria bacterium]
MKSSIKKIILFFLFLLALILIFFTFFPKKITKEKIENKVTQTFEKIEEVKETVAPKPTKILESGLPNKHLISTTFVEQSPEKNWDEPWQDACEEASLLTVDFYYRNKSTTSEFTKESILNMLSFEETRNYTHDMNISQMSTVAKDYLGYKSEIIDNPTVDQIKKYISQNTPVLVPAAGKILFKENNHFNSGGPYYHNIVILGYDDDKDQFTVHDVGTQFGAYFHYSYSLLMESIHDFPDSGQKEDINSGEKRVLVLLK